MGKENDNAELFTGQHRQRRTRYRAILGRARCTRGSTTGGFELRKDRRHDLTRHRRPAATPRLGGGSLLFHQPITQPKISHSIKVGT